MQRFCLMFALTIFTLGVAGCAQADCKTAALSSPPFYVPATLMIQPSTPLPDPAASALAFQVLPGANDDVFFVGRPEKAIYTALPLAEISAYSIFVYDAQRISAPHDSGYRYTWHVREGVSFP